MSKKVKPLARRVGVTRMCRRCAKFVPEEEFPSGGDWICAECTADGVPAAMPLVTYGNHQRYDTEAVFAGYRTIRVRQGTGREQYEVEVPSRAGEFYACGEAAVGLFTKTAHMANRLAAEFPEVRIVAHSDDGRCVLHFPVRLFPQIARRCGAFKSRAGREPTLKQAAAREQAAERMRRRNRSAAGKRQSSLL